jgi:hypothetical protein
MFNHHALRRAASEPPTLDLEGIKGGERRRFLAYLNGTANIMLSTALFPRVHVLYSKRYQFRNVSLKPNVSIYLYGQSCEIVKLSFNSNCSEKHVVVKPTTVDSRERVTFCQEYLNHSTLIHKMRYAPLCKLIASYN